MQCTYSELESDSSIVKLHARLRIRIVERAAIVGNVLLAHLVPSLINLWARQGDRILPGLRGVFCE